MCVCVYVCVCVCVCVCMCGCVYVCVCVCVYLLFATSYRMIITIEIVAQIAIVFTDIVTVIYNKF